MEEPFSELLKMRFSASWVSIDFYWGCTQSQFSCVQLYLWDPMDCSLLGSSVHRILQARILEWGAISISRGPSQSRDQTRISCIAGGFFTTEPLGEPFSQSTFVLNCYSSNRVCEDFIFIILLILQDIILTLFNTGKWQWYYLIWLFRQLSLPENK